MSFQPRSRTVVRLAAAQLSPFLLLTGCFRRPKRDCLYTTRSSSLLSLTKQRSLPKPRAWIDRRSVMVLFCGTSLLEEEVHDDNGLNRRYGSERIGNVVSGFGSME